MLPFKFRVKNPQHLPEHLLCTYRVSMCFEAIAELPRADGDGHRPRSRHHQALLTQFPHDRNRHPPGGLLEDGFGEQSIVRAKLIGAMAGSIAMFSPLNIPPEWCVPGSVTAAPRRSASRPAPPRDRPRRVHFRLKFNWPPGSCR